MNILQIAPYFPPYLGGQEKYVYLLCRELISKGHTVSVLTSNFPRSVPYEEYEGIKVHRKHCYGRLLRNPITPGLFFPGFDLQSFDLIHAHNEHSSAAVASIFHKRASSKPLVVTCHGKLVFGRKYADGFRNIYWKIIGRNILRAADEVTVATPSEKNRLILEGQLSPGKIKVVPVGIDLSDWERYSREEMNKSGFVGNSFDGRIVLLVATQLIQRKGIQFLLQAMPRIIEQHPNVICVIAGSGDYESYLRGSAASLGIDPFVIFVGILNNRELARAYRRADLFVLPSLSEGQPTCIMEAWAFSCPVVATQIEGVVDYFSDCAQLVDPGNAESLGDGILHLLAERELARKMGQRGYQLVQEKFTWEHISSQMIQVYEECLGGNGG